MAPALILSALQLIPKAVDLFRGKSDDSKLSVAGKIVDVAKALTGQNEAEAAIEAVKNDPKALIELQAQGKDIILAELDADVKMQAQVNETMRAGLVSQSLFKSGWRPAFGWVITPLFAVFIVQFVLIPGRLIAEDPVKAVLVINALKDYLAAIMWIWAAAFAVLGVNITKRSQDKRTAVGTPESPGLLSMLMKR